MLKGDVKLELTDGVYIFHFLKLRRYWTKVHQFYTQCSQIITDELFKKLLWRYCNPFGMPGLRIKVNSPILPILIVKLVAMATSLEAFVPRVRSVLADYGGPSAWNLLPDDLTPFPNVTLKFSSTPILAHATPYTFNHYYRHCSRYIRL